MAFFTPTSVNLLIRGRTMIPRRSARPEERLLVINPVMSVADQAARGDGGQET